MEDYALIIRQFEKQFSLSNVSALLAVIFLYKFVRIFFRNGESLHVEISISPNIETEIFSRFFSV